MTSHDRRSDQELLEATGFEPEAYAVFYRRHVRAVLGWTLSRTRRPELAADLTAEVFALALDRRERFDPERAPARAWLLSMASSKFVDAARRGSVEDRARRRLGIEPRALTDADLERVEELADLASGGDVAALVADLPPDQREAVLARIVDERSYEDIADGLRTSQSVIRQRVSRGLAALRQEAKGGKMTDFIDGLEHDLVDAARRSSRERRTAAVVRRRRLPGRGLAIALGALLVAGSATAAVVQLSAQPSRPLAGSIGASHRYAVSLLPDLRAGQAGWCAGVRYSTDGRARSSGMGCGTARARGGAMIAGSLAAVGQTIGFVVTTARVSAVRLPGAKLVASRPDPALPYGWRYVVTSLKPPDPRRRPDPQAAPVLLDAAGRELPAIVRADRSSRAGRSRAVTQADPARRCVIGRASGYRTAYARVAVARPRLPRRIEGRAFFSCAYTVFRAAGGRSSLTAAILLDALDPATRAASLPTAPGISARRVGRGWLVVRGESAEARSGLLARLRPRLSSR